MSSSKGKSGVAAGGLWRSSVLLLIQHKNADSAFPAKARAMVPPHMGTPAAGPLGPMHGDSGQHLAIEDVAAETKWSVEKLG